MEYLRKSEGKPLVVDIEGQGDPSKLHPTAHDVICVGLHNGTETLIVPRRVLGAPERHRRDGDAGLFPEMWDALAATKFVAHNALFDAVVLGYWLSGELKPIPIYRDTMLQYYITAPATNQEDLSLDSICSRRYGAPNWKLTDYSDMWGMDRERLYAYCAEDVQYEWMLFEDKEAEIQANPGFLFATETLISPFLNLTARQGPKGIRFDREYLEKELIPDLERDTEMSLLNLQELAENFAPEEGWTKRKDPLKSKYKKPVYYRAFNPASPKQVKQVLEARGLKTKDTSEGELKPHAEKGDEFCKALLEFRETSKGLGTYARAPIKHNDQSLHPWEDYRIFPTYNIQGTLSGRLSSSNPNIQNQPKVARYRRMYVASTPERVVMQADYSQAELRIMAALAGDSWLIDIFSNPDLDIFDEMMPGAFPDRPFVKGTKEASFMRRSLKTVVYGLAYDRQALAIAIELGMPVRQAQELMDNFLGSAKDLAAMRKDIKRLAHKRFGLKTRFGRYFQSGIISPGNQAAVERSALSFLPQSSASDCCLLAAIRLEQWIIDNNKDWDFFALVHDAINLDVPKEEAQEAADITKKMMADTAAEFFPEVAWKSEAGWGWSWDKTLD